MEQIVGSDLFDFSFIRWNLSTIAFAIDKHHETNAANEEKEKNTFHNGEHFQHNQFARRCVSISKYNSVWRMVNVDFFRLLRRLNEDLSITSPFRIIVMLCTYRVEFVRESIFILFSIQHFFMVLRSFLFIHRLSSVYTFVRYVHLPFLYPCLFDAITK